MLKENLAPNSESLAVICPGDGLTGQLMAGWKKLGENLAANDLMLTHGSPSKWFQMGSFFVLFPLFWQSLCITVI